MRSIKSVDNLRLQQSQSRTIERTQNIPSRHTTSKVIAHNDHSQQVAESIQRHEKESFIARSICLKVLKRRNLALFLLKCSHICSQTDLADTDDIMAVSFLFLKSSTQVITQLSKFLVTGRDSHFNLPQKEIHSFFKTADYLKLQAQIAKEMSLSKKHLNLMVEKIQKTYPNLFQVSSFANEASQQRINEQYFNQKIIQFVKESVSNERIKGENKIILNYLLLISYIKDFGSYEKLFQELINEEITELSNQTLIIKVDQMGSTEIITKLKLFCTENSDIKA